MATRRSPRSIERFCNELRLQNLTSEQTALLLSLSQLSGWSADRIALKIFELSRVRFTAEEVWDFHGNWILARKGRDDLNWEEQDIAEYLLTDAGIILTSSNPSVRLEYLGRPLHKTFEPTTVVFADEWAPLLQAVNKVPPCRGFEGQAREESKKWLARYGKKSWGDFTPTEEAGIAQFGSKIASIINDILRRYVRALRRKLRKDGPLKRMVDDESLALIFIYLHEFHCQYEQCFGYMEEHVNALGEITVNNIVRIRTTGYGAKLIAGLMMADRVQAAKLRQINELERVSLLQVDIKKIPKDSKDCPVCKEEMGATNIDGTQESCIQLVICCNQYFGEACLKTWLSAARNGGRTRASCPNCRYQFPQSFMDKLLGPEQEPEADSSSDDFEPAPSTDPESQQIINLITPSPSPQLQLDLNQESQVELATSPALAWYTEFQQTINPTTSSPPSQIQLDPTQESQLEVATTTMTAIIAEGGHMEIDLGPQSDDEFLMEG